MGDLNGDGFADFAVGDPDRIYVPGTEGVLWVFSGADATPLYALLPPGEVNVGIRCASLEDLDGDACRELLVTIGGAVLVVSGRTGTTLRRHPFVLPSDGFGNSLADAGDADLDGFTDYAVGAPEFSLNRTGHVYLYSGATGAEIRRFKGKESEGEFGWSVAGVGDTDGDGYPELLIGATNEHRTARHKRGAAHLRSGFDGAELGYFTSDVLEDSWIGVGVAGAGDTSGDGLADFWIASWASHSGGTGRGIVRNFALEPWLRVAPKEYSAATGGPVRLELNFPTSEAGKRYAVLVSSGAGRQRVGDAMLPLNRTPLLTRSAFAPPAAFRDQHGVLDFLGNARAGFVLAPGFAAPFIGRTLKFCALTLDPAGGVSLHSAAMPLTIGP